LYRQEEDQLKSVARCRDGDSIMLATSTGKVIRMEAASLVPQSRSAGGNKVARRYPGRGLCI
jgi:DNA gyrase/topoisomerase IV subunit A